MQADRGRNGSKPENWRLKLLMDAFGNALGTGLTAAGGLLYGTATGIFKPDPRVPVATGVLLAAVLWSLALWNAPAWLQRSDGSRRFPRIPDLPDVVVWGLGQLLAFGIFAAVLSLTGNSVAFAFWAIVFGFGIVVVLQFLDILHREEEATERTG
jgi:hypothetical protein